MFHIQAVRMSYNCKPLKHIKNTKLRLFAVSESKLPVIGIMGKLLFKILM